MMAHLNQIFYAIVIYLNKKGSINMYEMFIRTQVHTSTYKYVFDPHPYIAVTISGVYL